MDVISWQPFWSLKNGLRDPYPTLARSEKCDVLVVGGGITGALVALELVKAGLDTILLEKDDVAMGSTSGSTALLQYEIDVPLCELSGKIGADKAVRAYRACYESIDKIRSMNKRLGVGNGKRSSSVYLASRKSDVKFLEREGAARNLAGLGVALLSAREVSVRYGCVAPAALVSKQAAEIDPYALTHAILADGAKKGLRIFDRSKMNRFHSRAKGIEALCNEKFKIRAKKIVIATGYEANKYLPKGLVQLHSTYAAVTKPVGDGLQKIKGNIFWDTSDPYFYARTTRDSRVIFGGADEEFRDPGLRDSLIAHKTKILARRLEQKFPRLAVEVAYSWAGTFGETADGLPYIGELKPGSNCYFACGYGGNGITFSACAAEIIAARARGQMHPQADLFGFDRLD